MPQTRFVAAQGPGEQVLRPIVLHQQDRSGAGSTRAGGSTKVLDLFLESSAPTTDQCDFPYLFGSGMGGFAKAGQRLKATT